MNDSRHAASIRVEGVTVTYANGVTAIRNAGFHLGASSICALVGVNGSGKSTLFKTLMGFLKPSSGSVTIAGMHVPAALKAGMVAYVPQAEEVDWTFPVLVRDVVMMGRYGHMGFLRRPRAADRAAVEEALERVSMSAFATRQIGELSGGQRKRVFLARALAQARARHPARRALHRRRREAEAAIIAILEELRLAAA